MEARDNMGRFSGREWLTLLLGLALALLWREVFAAYKLMQGVPALGACVFTLAAWAAVLLALGKRAKWTRANIFVAVTVNLTALSCAFQWSEDIRLVSFFVIFCGSVMGFLSLADTEQCAITEAGAIKEAIIDFFRGVFANWGKPFLAVYRLAPEGKKSLGGVLLGVVIAVPLLAVVLYGMSFADEMFNAYVLGAITSLTDSEKFWNALIKGVDIVIWTLVFFSSLYFLSHEPKRKEPLTKFDRLPVSALLTVEVLLTAVCGLFAVIQFKYLFGGAEAAAMSGGWAEYARSGFYSLVGVAFVVCAGALGCARAGRENMFARVLTLVLIALTFVILTSAAYRLYLYVAAYGLSVLRVMAAWAIAAVGVCLVLVGVKTLRAGFRFWPWAAGIVLVMWMAFAFVNVQGLVARYNVGAYMDGRLDTLDTEYIASLSPAALGALYDLREDAAWPQQLDDVIKALEQYPERDWALSVLGGGAK